MPRKAKRSEPRKGVPEEDKENPDTEYDLPTSKAAKFDHQRTSFVRTTLSDTRDTQAETDTHAAATRAEEAPAVEDALLTTFQSFQAKFDAVNDPGVSTLASNVVERYAAAMDHVANARQQLRDFADQAQRCLDEIQSVIEMSAQRGMEAAIERAREVDMVTARLEQAKKYVRLLNAATNTDDVSVNPEFVT